MAEGMRAEEARPVRMIQQRGHSACIDAQPSSLQVVPRAVGRDRGGVHLGSVVGALTGRLLVWSSDERGDVPGWVLVTAMTVALVMMIWGVASSALRDILSQVLDGLRFGS
jgi:hypothetical protein